MTELAAAIRDIPMPQRMRKLPLSDKGFPIPGFVAWLDESRTRYLSPGAAGAVRDFRIIDHRYLDRCFHYSRCWICGEPLGQHRVFAIGPMCAINRITMEPPSHRDCAEYATRACPFMASPRMRRNAKDRPGEGYAPGVMVDRNPGAYCLWETRSYSRFNAGNGMLCQLGEPTRVDWWSAGRTATRAEVMESIESGVPLLMDMAVKEGPNAVAELVRQHERALKLMPPELV